MAREPLNGRRLTQTFDMAYTDMSSGAVVGRVTVSVGHYVDGRIGEVFVSTNKIGTMFDTSARDAAVLISVALQHGASLATLRKSLTESANGAAEGRAGQMLDAMIAVAAEMEG